SEEAALTFSALGMSHRSASAKISGAVAVLYDGDPDRASRAFWESLQDIDVKEDPTLLLAARINLVRCYVDLGRPAGVRRAYQVLQQTKLGNAPLVALRLEWQKGLVLNVLDERAEAARTLGRVRSAFIERRLAREAIVVTRDLAQTFEHLGESERASSLRTETASWLQRMNFGSETSRF